MHVIFVGKREGKRPLRKTYVDVRLILQYSLGKHRRCELDLLSHNIDHLQALIHMKTELQVLQ
jgi:hypothetical protein